MNKKKIILFAVCLAGLLALQIKLFMPMMFDIAASDLFLVDSKDEASATPINNDMTTLAFMHCNNHISSKIKPENIVSFANKPSLVFGEGNYSYIIKSEVSLTLNNTSPTVYHYACKIQYEKGDDLSGVGDSENWSIVGIDGLPDL